MLWKTTIKVLKNKRPVQGVFLLHKFRGGEQMHSIAGYSWDELLAIVTIASIVGGFLIYLLNLAIKNGTEKLSNMVKDLIVRIDNLNHTMNSIESTANRTADRVDSLEERFEEHVGEAKVRNQKIKALEHEVFGRSENE